VDEGLAVRERASALVGDVRIGGEVRERGMGADVPSRVDQQDRAHGKRMMHRAGGDEQVVAARHGAGVDQHRRIHVFVSVHFGRPAAVRTHGPQALHCNHSLVHVLPSRIQHPPIVHQARCRLAQRIAREQREVAPVAIDPVQHVDAQVIRFVAQHAPFAS